MTGPLFNEIICKYYKFIHKKGLARIGRGGQNLKNTRTRVCKIIISLFPFFYVKGWKMGTLKSLFYHVSSKCAEKISRSKVWIETFNHSKRSMGLGVGFYL